MKPIVSDLGEGLSTKGAIGPTENSDLVIAVNAAKNMKIGVAKNERKENLEMPDRP